MEFSKQEYWNGLAFPTPGDLPDPEIEPGSPALQADSFPIEPPGKPLIGDNKWKTGKNCKYSYFEIRNAVNSVNTSEPCHHPQSYSFRKSLSGETQFFRGNHPEGLNFLLLTLRLLVLPSSSVSASSFPHQKGQWRFDIL